MTIPIEYRLISDDEGDHWFIIRADEVPVFFKWLAAMKGQRHFPQNFTPIQIDRVENLRFTGWREEEGGG